MTDATSESPLRSRDAVSAATAEAAGRCQRGVAASTLRQPSSVLKRLTEDLRCSGRNVDIDALMLRRYSASVRWNDKNECLSHRSADLSLICRFDKRRRSAAAPGTRSSQPQGKLPVYPGV